jgi:hypothetical protein
MSARKYVDNMSARNRRKYVGPKKNFFSGALPPNPRAGGSAPLHPPRGGLAAPPLTPLRARRRRSDTTTRAKNITHTQQFSLLEITYFIVKENNLNKTNHKRKNLRKKINKSYVDDVLLMIESVRTETTTSRAYKSPLHYNRGGTPPRFKIFLEFYIFKIIKDFEKVCCNIQRNKKIALKKFFCF